MPELLLHGRGERTAVAEGVFAGEWDGADFSWLGRVRSPGGDSMTVHLDNTTRGWRLGVLAGADRGCAPWPMRLAPSGDGPVLVLDGPEGTVVEEIGNA